MHQNIQSLRNKTLQIEALIYSLVNKPAVLCLSEHWFQEHEGLEFVRISGYRLVSFFARATLQHGGVCIFSQENLDFMEENSIVRLSIEGVVEFAGAVEKGQKILVICLYRRTLGSFDAFIEQIEKLVNYAYQHYFNYRIVIAGDFNLNLYESNNQTKLFIDLMNSFNLTQTIFNATRVTEGSSTLIDNIFCNLTSDLEATGYVLNTALCDHHAQVLCMDGVDIFQSNSGKNNFILKRVISENKIGHFRRELQNVDWTSVYEFNDVDNAYNAFLNILKNHFNQIFVFKKINITKQRKSWISTGIRTSCRNKRILYYKKIKGQISGEYFSRYCKILKKNDYSS